MTATMLRSALLISGIAASALCQAQALTDSSQLRGSWIITGSRNAEALTFSSDDEFVYSYSFTSEAASGSKQTHRHSVGAYHVTTGMCTVGTDKGNLWLVLDSRRCCFSAYAMQRTIVLDRVGSSSQRIPELCENKTLRRDAK